MGMNECRTTTGQGLDLGGWEREKEARELQKPKNAKASYRIMQGGREERPGNTGTQKSCRLWPADHWKT